ncbi:MAG: oxygen-independent coproporphyrinogen III oxidase [Cyclobacteriaceae bacterium]
MDKSKYNLPVPRYTSYPTVPFWNNENFSEQGYSKTLRTAYWSSSKEVSIYIHLPFCESLCTYCACNTRITKNHAVEDPYIENVLKEWDLYLKQLPDSPMIREIHLGGGTPTFFSAKNLEKLISGIFKSGIVSPHASMSFEGHPANTTSHHLRLLHDLGFDRLSLGIQDFDLDVQRLINRMQTFEQVKKVTEEARAIGYTSINFDMVYGLPGQTIESLEETLEKVSLLSPERIAYYSYAHVPSMKPAQKSYEEHLPEDSLKLRFMKLGRERLATYGYEEVGMDHFVKPEDELMVAREQNELHRNFMGYTPFSSQLLIGLGVSAISDSWSGFAQNEKTVEEYYERLNQDQLPIIKGHLHTREDLFFRRNILNLMCEFKTSWSRQDFMEFGVGMNFPLIDQLAKDGLIEFDEEGIQVLPEGREYIRVICSALDVGLSNTSKSPMFSKSI